MVFLSSQLYSTRFYFNEIIIHFDNWHFKFYTRKTFSNLPSQKWKTKVSIFVLDFLIVVKHKNAVQTRKKLYAMYGETVLTKRQCQNCFPKFRSQSCITFCKADWGWWRPNKGIGARKSLRNNTGNCWQVEFT